jgi:hypothetical protein
LKQAKKAVVPNDFLSLKDGIKQYAKDRDIDKLVSLADRLLLQKYAMFNLFRGELQYKVKIFVNY